jgi:hypothetical protein
MASGPLNMASIWKCEGGAAAVGWIVSVGGRQQYKLSVAQ